MNVDTIYLQEYEVKEVEGLTSSQIQLLRNNFAKYVSLQPSWQDNKHLLRAKHYVGTIVLDDRRIIIKPKVPASNLFYMLTYAYDLVNFRQEISQLEVGDDLFEFVVIIFLQQVEQLIRQGIQQGYVKQETNQNFLRGRLLLAPHLQKNVVKVHHFYQRFSQFTVDIDENRILKYTLERLLKLDYRQVDLRLHIRRVLSAFSGVSWQPITPYDCEQVQYTRLNRRYQTAIQLSRLLIQNLSLESGEGQISAAAYLFDMNKLFEQFIGSFLAEYFTKYPAWSVTLQEEIWLDSQGGEKGYPDIVLRYRNQPHIILDVKYKKFKKRPERNDLNQMFVYCHTLNVHHGIFVYANSSVEVYQSRLHKAYIQALFLPLEGRLEQFQQRCYQFAEQFRERALSTITDGEDG
ncbi:MAG TPA: hypothetical protein VLL52_14670 [Anaerolineae bacterium]|nr:hypothetical protein [Anaerolineae bacterium]